MPNVYVVVNVKKFVLHPYYPSSYTGLLKANNGNNRSNTICLIALNVEPVVTFVQVKFLWSITTGLQNQKSDI